MIEPIDLSLVDWSRGQFALTAMYHWLFVPLTLGLSFLIAIMETIYVRTGDLFWKKTTKFWMTIFGINLQLELQPELSSSLNLARTGQTIHGLLGIFLALHWPLKELWHFSWNQLSLP